MNNGHILILLKKEMERGALAGKGGWFGRE
jgi:hypothetical protein